MVNREEVERALALPDTAAPSHLAAELTPACTDGDVTRVRQLLADGADARHQVEGSGMSALMVAAQQGHTAAVEALLAHGAPWNAQDTREMSAGDYAMDNGHEEVCIADCIAHVARKHSLPAWCRVCARAGLWWPSHADLGRVDVKRSMRCWSAQ